MKEVTVGAGQQEKQDKNKYERKSSSCKFVLTKNTNPVHEQGTNTSWLSVSIHTYTYDPRNIFLMSTYTSEDELLLVTWILFSP